MITGSILPPPGLASAGCAEGCAPLFSFVSSAKEGKYAVYEMRQRRPPSLATPAASPLPGLARLSKY